MSIRSMSFLLLFNGHAFHVSSGPSSRGGVLQWGRPEGNMRRPVFESQEDIVISERTHAAAHEDPDVAPSCETTVPDAKQVPTSDFLHITARRV